MDRFSFKLQRVLDFRVNLEEKKKEEFVSSLRNHMHQEKLLKKFEEDRNSSSKSVANFRTSIEYQNYSRYLEYMDNKIEEQRFKLHTANEELEKKKEELIKSTADRKVIDKLKEKALKEFEREQLLKEQRLNDDFALFAYLKSERR